MREHAHYDAEVAQEQLAAERKIIKRIAREASGRGSGDRGRVRRSARPLICRALVQLQIGRFLDLLQHAMPVEPEGSRVSYIRYWCAERAHWKRNVLMIRKLFATSSLVAMVIVGAAALAYAAPDPSESGPSMSDSTTSTTSTTSATNAPYPGHSGYGY
jgi:hypothetical protein